MPEFSKHAEESLRDALALALTVRRDPEAATAMVTAADPEERAAMCLALAAALSVLLNEPDDSQEGLRALFATLNTDGWADQ